MTRVLVLGLAVALTAFIAIAGVLDIVHHGFTWPDALALLIVVLFATGIFGSLWESIRRD